MSTVENVFPDRPDPNEENSSKRNPGLSDGENVLETPKELQDIVDVLRDDLNRCLAYSATDSFGAPLFRTPAESCHEISEAVSARLEELDFNVVELAEAIDRPLDEVTAIVNGQDFDVSDSALITALEQVLKMQLRHL